MDITTLVSRSKPHLHSYLLISNPSRVIITDWKYIQLMTISSALAIISSVVVQIYFLVALRKIKIHIRVILNLQVFVSMDASRGLNEIPSDRTENRSLD